MDWNRRYVEGDTPWDKGSAHPAIEFAMRQNALTGRILVPGCGTGHDVRALASCGLEVTGLDLAPVALQTAQSLDPDRRARYVLGDLFDLPGELRGAFNGVFEHTCFCAIDPARRGEYVDAVASALELGGKLLAVFFLEPGNDGDGPPFGCMRSEVDRLFTGPFRSLREWEEIPTYPGREGRELLRLLERV